MKILLIQHHNFLNGSGGTEKVCSSLANGFSHLGHEVVIATNENIDGKAVFPLNENIKVNNIFDINIPQTELKSVFNYHGYHPLKWIFYKLKKKRTKRINKKILKKFGGVEGILKNNLRIRAKAWKNYIEALKPNVIITMSVGSLLEISFKNQYQIPIVNSVNGRPDYDYSDILWFRSPTEMILLKESYKTLSGIQILFESYKDFLPETFTGKTKVIPNSVPQFSDNELVNHCDPKSKFRIINIATLNTECKQQHIAIDTFAAVSEKYPNWELHFWGVGKDFDFLDDKIRQLNLQNRIFLNGFTDNPISKLKDSDIFIFPSKYEGFPLALTEAMSIGLPSLGFSACSGVNELIQHGKNGFLAKDNKELIMYLEELIENTNLRFTMGQNAHEKMAKFNPQSIIDEWELFLKTICSQFNKAEVFY